MAHQFLCSKTAPIVETRAGKLRGFLLNGTYTFHGIKYADAKRFQPPVPVKPWEGVKNALAYGYVCPMLKQDKPSIEAMIPHRYWSMNEHCQYLNIWTQSIEPSAKKPVLVWLHGGGFVAGSSIEHVAYDGTAMSQYGDVVVVTLNHRLNILGYLDLSPFGEKYANSCNAGNADIVAALEWIRDNIGNFGGDPDNVTIFGQSGGGMKVWALMQTPAADGLFHKAIIQSGRLEHYVAEEPADGRKIVAAMMKALRIKKVESLEKVPYHRLAEAYNKVAPALREAGEYIGCTPAPNDWYLGDPVLVGFTKHAKTIPCMVGTVLGEFSFMPALDPDVKNNPKMVDALLAERYGEDAGELKKLFAQVYPDKHISDLLFLDSVMRGPSGRLIRAKAQHGESETFSFLFTYTFPYDDGHIAWHCAEILFVFHNTHLVGAYNEEGVTDLLEKQICDAWLNFARTGKPSSDALPDWPACTPEDEACMIFDRECRVRHNHDHALIALHEKAAPPINFEAEDDEENQIQH